jgi:membrane protein YdbS with pleckstrin-like domain
VTKERPGKQREMHEPARALDRLVDVIPAAIVFIVAVIMAIGAAFLGYPVWAIPVIAIFGAGGAIVAIRVIGW